MRRIFSPISLAALATATLTATAASAQVTADPAPAATEATATATATPGADPAVADIVVTAQRRSENLKDVPVSVATIDNQTLAAISTGGADIRALSGRVPSLNIESSFGRTFPRFYIRGLGNTDFDLNASQPVSLVYDDVVLENPILKGFPVFDVSQVEVLRGPQGTLFGRNTPAGIVKFDTVRPGHGGNYAKVSVGTYLTTNAEGAVGGQVSDTVAVRLSGLWQHRNDWIDNLDEPGKHNLEGYDDIALRGQIEFAPTEQLKVRLTGQLRDYKGNARIFRANSFRTGSNKLHGADGGDFDRDEVRADGINFQRLKNYNAGLSAEYDFGPVTAYSITSYWNGKLNSRGDIDGGFGCGGFGCVGPTGPGFIPFSAHTADNVPSLDQFTQEVRIASNNKGGLGYQAGVFYFNENLDIESFDFVAPNSTMVNAIALQRQDSDALGIFGSINYKFDNGLTLQGGARWNHDKRKMKASRPFDTRGFTGPPVPEKTGEVKDSVLTWDLSALYSLSDDINLFARVAKGYRAPAIQGRLLFGSDLSFADSEKTMSYEAGFKSTLLDRKLRFNLTAYYFDTKDLQLTAVGGASNFTTLLNADHVRGHGVEAELEARPARGLTLTAGVGYNRTKIDSPGLGVSGCAAACTVLDPVIVPPVGFNPAIYSIDGNSLPQSPKWTINWTAGYEHPMGHGSLYVFTDWYYRSKVDFFLYKSVEFSDDRLLEGGLRLGYKTDRFDVAAFGRNITNDESAVSGIDFNNLTAMVNEPRIFGVEAGIKF